MEGNVFRKTNTGRKNRIALLVFGLMTAFGAGAQAGDTAPGRDPKQPINEEYTRKIQEYTTQANFTSPLVNYLPASKTVPAPDAVLGNIAGAPGILPYSQQVYQYMRMLEKASPRVKVFSIGHTEEGREMIAVAVQHSAGGEDSSGARGASRVAAHLAEHADRRLVAAGARQPGHSLRLHQHAAGGAGRRPPREIRRHPVSTGWAGRPKPDHQWAADRMGKCVAVEDDSGNPQHRKRRLDR